MQSAAESDLDKAMNGVADVIEPFIALAEKNSRGETGVGAPLESQGRDYTSAELDALEPIVSANMREIVFLRRQVSTLPMNVYAGNLTQERALKGIADLTEWSRRYAAARPAHLSTAEMVRAVAAKIPQNNASLARRMSEVASDLADTNFWIPYLDREFGERGTVRRTIADYRSAISGLRSVMHIHTMTVFNELWTREGNARIENAIPLSTCDRLRERLTSASSKTRVELRYETTVTGIGRRMASSSEAFPPQPLGGLTDEERARQDPAGTYLYDMSAFLVFERGDHVFKVPQPVGETYLALVNGRFRITTRDRVQNNVTLGRDGKFENVPWPQTLTLTTATWRVPRNPSSRVEEETRSSCVSGYRGNPVAGNGTVFR